MMIVHSGADHRPQTALLPRCIAAALRARGRTPHLLPMDWHTQSGGGGTPPGQHRPPSGPPLAGEAQRAQLRRVERLPSHARPAPPGGSKWGWWRAGGCEATDPLPPMEPPPTLVARSPHFSPNQRTECGRECIPLDYRMLCRRVWLILLPQHPADPTPPSPRAQRTRVTWCIRQGAEQVTAQSPVRTPTKGRGASAASAWPHTAQGQWPYLQGQGSIQPEYHFHRVTGEHNFYSSWSCLLLSTAARMQVAVLWQHPILNTLRATKMSIRKCCARRPGCVAASIDWAVRVSRILPAPPLPLLILYLQQSSVWWKAKYASWHAPHKGPWSEHFADWCTDFSVLCTLHL